MTIKCLIVDDEPLALDVIENHISKIPFLKLINKCKSAMEAMQAMKEENIDLLFLDIQMPDLTGIDLLNSLNKKPLVIFTTAYNEYAVTSYEFDAVDYLLKPIRFERFLKAVDKVYEKINRKEETPKIESTSDSTQKDFIFIKTDYKTVRVSLSDVLYIEGLQGYVIIKTEKEQIISLLSMNHVQETLPDNLFVRIHRSFIVSLNKIDSIERGRLHIKDKVIPIGKSYAEHFKIVINNRKL